MVQQAGSMVVLAAHPNPELYGADRVFLETVEGLLAQGHRVVATLPDNGPLCAELAERGAETRICPTPILRKSSQTPVGLLKLAVKSIHDLVHGLSLMRRVRPDVVYVSTVTIPLWLVLARLCRIPAMAHVHEAEKSASRVSKLALIAPLQLATSIIVNSHFSATVLTDTIPRLRKKSTVIYNGVPGPPTVQDPRPTPDDPFRVLYIGRLSLRKGVDIVIEAIAAVRARGIDAHLDIVGAVYPGYEWYEAQLHEMTSSLGLGDCVTFHGFCADVWPFLAQTDVSVVPSRMDEPFGNTAVEAILAGRPVVVSDSAGLREAAGGYLAQHHVSVDCPLAIADAIEQIRGDWEESRLTAMADASTAAMRHDTKTYQHRIAEALERIRRPRQQ